MLFALGASGAFGQRVAASIDMALFVTDSVPTFRFDGPGDAQVTTLTVALVFGKIIRISTVRLSLR